MLESCDARAEGHLRQSFNSQAGFTAVDAIQGICQTVAAEITSKAVLSSTRASTQVQ